MESKKFIEVVNWDKAQPRMTGENNTWYKQYNSILDNDRIAALDDKSYRLLTGLWALSARMGTNIFPADPKWLMRRMAFLRDEPDLKPLMNVRDIFGREAPFVRFCEPPNGQPEDEKNDDTKKENEKPAEPAKEPKKDELEEKALNIVKESGYASTAELQRKLNIGYARASIIIKTFVNNGLLGEYVGGKGRPLLSHSKREERRESRTEETESLRIPEERKEREEENGLDREETQNPSRADTEQINETSEPVEQEQAQKPVNPMESEAGADDVHHVPKQPRSAFRGGNPQRIGSIISGVFREHWQDPDAEAFGWEIVKALGYPVDRENEFSRGEWGSFASFWVEAKKKIPFEFHGEFRDIAIKKAEYVNSPKGKWLNKSAGWFSLVYKSLEKRGINLQGAKAGTI